MSIIEKRMHNVSMPNVLIRDLPPNVHSALIARAEQAGQSLQQYLAHELAKLVATPTLAELFAEIDARGIGASVTSDEILEAIRRGRERTQ